MGKIRLILPKLFILLVIVSGCSSINNTKNKLMPSGQDYVKSPWKNYQEVEEIYNKIIPYITYLDELPFDSNRVSNVVRLSPLDIQNLFLSSQSMTVDKLPAGIQDCLKNYDKCYGFKLTAKHIKRKGDGSLLLRIFTFKKKDILKGFDVSFHIFLIKQNDSRDLIVYKLPPSGTREINTEKTETNPLGPVQNLGNLLEKGVGAIIPVP